MFNYDQIQHLSQDLNSFLTGSTLIDCISKDDKQILLIFEQKNKIRRLLLCFKKPFIRFHLVSHAYEAKNESPHEPLQRYLSGTTLKSVEAMNQDRIVQFQFCSNSKSFFLICEFFSKHPNYYVTNSDYHILYSLYRSKQNIYYFPPSNPLSLHSNQVFNHAEIEKQYAELEKKQFFEEEKKRLQKELKKNLKNIYARKTKLIESIEACKNWESAQHEGDLIKANLSLFKKGQFNLTVQDWLTNQPYLIKIDPRSTPQEKMSQCFQRSRKLQKGLIPLLGQLEKVVQKIERIEKQLDELAEIHTMAELAEKKSQLLPAQIKPSHATKKERKALPYHAFQSSSGMQIWVGKNAKANEWLTFHAANGNDWWLHVQGSPGSHVIIKPNKGQQPDPDTLQDAMQLALLYSQSKDQGEAEITVTQRKYVSRFGKGQSGKVQLSKHTTNWVHLDRERCKRIKERKSGFHS